MRASARRRSARSISRSWGPPSLREVPSSVARPSSDETMIPLTHGRSSGAAASPTRSSAVTGARSGQMRSRLKARRSYHGQWGGPADGPPPYKPLGDHRGRGRGAARAGCLPALVRAEHGQPQRERQRRARRCLGVRHVLDLALAAARGGGRAHRPALHRRPRPRAVMAAWRDDGGHRHHRLRPDRLRRHHRSAGRAAERDRPRLRLVHVAARHDHDRGRWRLPRLDHRTSPQATGSVLSGPSGGPPRTWTGAAGAWLCPQSGQGLRHCTLPASFPGIRLHPAQAHADPQEEPLMPPRNVPDRNLALELVRVTEAAALAAGRYVGRGDKEAADQAAVDGMHAVLHTIHMDGIVVIGEGEKDEAPMLANGEEVGDGSDPKVDIAVDPLEGTRLCAEGRPNALAVIALSERDTMFNPGPVFYMEKMAGDEQIADLLDLDRPLGKTVQLVAEPRGVEVRDVMVVVLDRPRHEEGIRAIRDAGARVRLITDGDVAGVLLAVSRRSTVDFLWGIGGTPEGVISACAVKCMGGGQIGRLWLRDDAERQGAIDAGYDLSRVL